MGRVGYCARTFTEGTDHSRCQTLHLLKSSSAEIGPLESRLELLAVLSAGHHAEHEADTLGLARLNLFLQALSAIHGPLRRRKI